MDIVVKFGYRSYVFHSDNNVNFARKLWLLCPDNEPFERALEEFNIEFEYDLSEYGL